MPNTNPQAVRVSNEKIRPAADRFGGLYHLLTALAAESNAENWLALFPNDTEVIEDGSAVDGRTPITNADVRAFITASADFLTFMNANSFEKRNLVLKIAVHPEL